MIFRFFELFIVSLFPRFLKIIGIELIIGRLVPDLSYSPTIVYYCVGR